MGKKKEATEEVKETKERAAVGRERRLALALRAMLDAGFPDVSSEEAEVAEADATALLNELGYGELEGTSRRIARLEKDLLAATQDQDYAEVTRLGKELQKAQSGKFRMTSTPPAKDADDK